MLVHGKADIAVHKCALADSHVDYALRLLVWQTHAWHRRHVRRVIRRVIAVVRIVVFPPFELGFVLLILLLLEVRGVTPHEPCLELLSNQIKAHEVRNPIKNLLAADQNIPHANFNFRNCERNYQKDFVQFQTYYFGFFQKHVFFV